MAEPRREGKEAQPGGEPPPAALPEDDAGRGLEPSSRAPRRGAWPLPGPLPLTFNPGCWRAFLPPLLVRWAGRPVGRALGGGRVCRKAGPEHSWATSGGAQGTKWDRRQPFIPRGERPP